VTTSASVAGRRIRNGNDNPWSSSQFIPASIQPISGGWLYWASAIFSPYSLIGPNSRTPFANLAKFRTSLLPPVVAAR
jgi:hypothetical protein